MLHLLAKNFLVCDNWYCDMPGHTLPNRSFIHCGTTGCVGIDDTDSGQSNCPAIFDLIDQLIPANRTLEKRNWKMYAPVATLNGKTSLGQLDARFLNQNLQSYQGVPITDFEADCRNGTLPFYSDQRQ